MIYQLLGGIVVAAGVFAAVLWSIFQAVTQRGKLQVVHILAIAGSIAGMASLSMVNPTMAWFVGVELGVAAVAAIYLETAWNRLLPAFQLIFAITLILGLPFNAA